MWREVHGEEEADYEMVIRYYSGINKNGVERSISRLLEERRSFNYSGEGAASFRAWALLPFFPRVKRSFVCLGEKRLETSGATVEQDKVRL
ncbi:hypothetical protein E2C01_040050 [Portunus trituberculatus]|uniref:Uncharacterized protein n=1 Tax=Portunus trituberculatus TaxID=210409 RepID=A0A5B7FMJ3_PORTR|nr:hypothetical protein [Portunus trituberculatus]